MSTYNIPTIDFSDFSNRYATVAEQIFDACKNIGFFHIINYETPSILQVEQAFDLSKQFFELPTEEKIKFKQDSNQKKIEGYMEIYSQRFDPKNQKKGDFKENFDMETLTDTKNIEHFPKLFQNHRSDLQAFSKGMHETALRVLELLTFALKLPPNDKTGANDWLSSSHAYDGKGSTSVLRFLRYPNRTPEDEEDGSDNADSEIILAGQHTDFIMITLLYQNAPGLQVRVSDDSWLTVPVVNNAILVNLGGMFSYFTNGLFKSAMHRVIDMPDQRNRMDRYSIGYFVYPETGTMITNMPSPLIPCERPNFKEVPKDIKITTSNEYLDYRHQRSLAAKQSSNTNGEYDVI
ncbi:hypothetical protein BDA99DRAFT_527404 [Phascolomyces articulosus]|uniref:Fe2OG dioxygenase domain-containing protein n=1 Tax=Phascolomyces articulosus TaxID=60185 RepID=A0AAD5JND3_9FUNG|nr:hypothetical protein BDA99DRAFT_527404 [Phascolomyces articulosus]